MHLPAAFFALGIALAVFYLPRTAGRVCWSRSIRKTLPVALFALAAYFQGAPVLLVAALGLSALGDLALSRPGERAFLAGMLAFASAHIAYIVLMVALGTGPQPAQWPLILSLVALGISTEFWLRPYTGALKWPVRGYVAIILAMALAAPGLPETRNAALWGAMLFVVSDLVLSIETFVMNVSNPWRKRAGKAVWISYIFAQIGLFWGLGVL